MLGGLAKYIWGRQFWGVPNILQCTVFLLLTPRLIDLWGVTLFPAAGTFDSSQYGDILADRWNLYAFGPLDLHSFLPALPGFPPQTLGSAYDRYGFTSAPGPLGFQQLILASGSSGRAVYIGLRLDLGHLSDIFIYPVWQPKTRP